ncbi:carboxyltransferase domain-containing protein [Bradyrhizobium sp. RDT10]
MYGFAPGYIYLGGLPEALAISKRPSPRGPSTRLDDRFHETSVLERIV